MCDDDEDTRTYHVIAHCNKEIKKQLSALFHLHLHCTTALECGSASDDESKLVCSKFGVGVGGVGIGITG